MNRAFARDAAASEILGTSILLAATVMLVAVAAVMLDAREAAVDSRRVDLTVTARAGNSTLTLTHAGGETYDQGSLHVSVAVNESTWYSGTLGPSGVLWGLGDAVPIALASPLPVDARVDVTLYSDADGTLAMTTVRATKSQTVVLIPGSFTVAVRFGGSINTTTVRPPETILVQAIVNHGDGRKAIHSVTANLSPIGGSASLRLLDTGVGGDDVAGDSTFAALGTVAVSAKQKTYVIRVTATDVYGATKTATGLVTVVETYPVFNKSMFSHIGLRMFKYAGSGGGDKLTIDLKVQPLADPMTFPDGNEWTLWKAYAYYEDFKWGGDRIELSAGGTSPNFWSCSVGSPPIKLFKAENATISKYDIAADVIRVFITLEWKRVTSSQTMTTAVGSPELDAYFVFPREELIKEIRHEGWPASFNNCSA